VLDVMPNRIWNMINDESSLSSATPRCRVVKMLKVVKWWLVC